MKKELEKKEKTLLMLKRLKSELDDIENVINKIRKQTAKEIFADLDSLWKTGIFGIEFQDYMDYKELKRKYLKGESR